MNKKRAIIYARVSTLLEQDPQIQVESCISLAQHRQFNVIDTYIDRCSGSKDSRPELNRMLEDARRGKFEVLIVSAIDRLGRSSKGLLQILEKLRCWNITPIFIRENIDLETPTGVLIFSFLGAIAEFERSIISERVKTALRVKKALAERTNSGWTCGRPPLNKDLKQNVLCLHKQGLSIRAIAKQLGTLSKSSVNRIILDSKKTVQKTEPD